FQLGQTVTAGIVSAKSRRVPNKASGPYDAFIQTDASINPGSSGGPLFNTRGQLVGINTAIFSPGRTQFGGTGFNIGIGFSIPSNLVRTVVTQLKENGRVVRGLLGVIIQRVDGDMATALNLPGPDGALVADVVPNSPASKAGFQRKDVILSFNQQSVRDHEDLPLLVATTPIGSKVSVDILRGGKKKTLVAVIEELKEVAAAKNSDSPKTDKIGLVVQNVTEDVAKSLKMTAPAGALVGTVEPGSTAERAGIQRGDVIEELNGQLVRDAEHFEKLVPELPVDKPLLVMVRRTEGTRFLTMRIKPAPKS
ncbi:MAG: PDZ domain-containing protein, partial [Deltaproteobacteria bacterium]|nr:PDZ domain-containing protein [Deltaproteobacteria bacterium]